MSIKFILNEMGLQEKQRVSVRTEMHHVIAFEIGVKLHHARHISKLS